MLTLDVPVEPYWLDLPRGRRLEIRPVTAVVMAAAQTGSALSICSSTILAAVLRYHHTGTEYAL